MKPLERIRALVAGKPTDHLSAQPIVMMLAAKYSGKTFLDYTKDAHIMADCQLRIAEDLGIDVLLTCSDPAREVVDIAGEGSIVWFEDQGPVIDEEKAALLETTRLRTLKLPGLIEGGRMHDRVRGIEKMYAKAGGDLSVVGWIEGPLALAQELRGLSRIMIDLIEDPTFVNDLLDFTAEVAMEYVPIQIEAGADTIGMSDAAASIIGPKYYERYVLPRQIRVLSSIKAKSPQTITRVHMCGDATLLLPLMAQLPADIIELDFPVDLAEARKKLNPNHIISGNVSTVTDLLHGTPEDVYDSAANCFAKVGPKYIAGSGCEISPLSPLENVKAIVDFASTH